MQPSLMLRGIDHDWRRPPPARASLPSGQKWCTHAADGTFLLHLSSGPCTQVQVLSASSLEVRPGRVGKAVHPGPDGNGLEAILGPLLKSVKTAMQKLVAQASNSLGQAGLPACSAKNDEA